MEGTKTISAFVQLIKRIKFFLEWTKILSTFVQQTGSFNLEEDGIF